MSENRELERIQTVVIGGGQAGLSVGYYLKRSGLPFVILDAQKRVGDAWRKRWDSLKLFTPARFDGLPGMRFPAHSRALVSKDSMADYLEAYTRKFDLQVCTGVRVTNLSTEGGRFLISAGSQRIEAQNVVVAMANYQVPKVPSFAQELAPDIVQVHSSDYKNPAQLRDGSVLIVGGGNSGSEIGIEVSRSHATWLSGKDNGHVPFRIEGVAGRFVLVSVVRFVGHHILTVRTPLGRKVRPEFLSGAAPLVRVKPNDLAAAGIERVARVVGVRDGRPLLDDDRVLDAANVVWCTGYRPGFSWIDLPILDENEEPRHERGIVPEEPGLYFVGLNFLYAATSDTVTGVSRDARRVARVISSRVRAERP